LTLDCILEDFRFPQQFLQCRVFGVIATKVTEEVAYILEKPNTSVFKPENGSGRYRHIVTCFFFTLSFRVNIPDCQS